MKKLSLLFAILPLAAVAQTTGSSAASRVAALLAAGVSGGSQGLYLKQVGGAVAASQKETFVFDPGTAAEIVTLLSAIQQVESRAFSLDSSVPHYDNLPGSCPSPLVPNGTESLSVALRELIWRSDNARSVGLHNLFGLSKLNDLAASIGMKSTSLPALPGCQTATPGQLTLADAATLLEGVESGALVAGRASFNSFLSGRTQAAAEGSDSSRLWSADLPAMIRQESPSGTTAAQQSAYLASMDLGYATGSTIKCQTAGCTSILESLSIAGWARVPYCAATGNASHDFVFGEFISGAVDSSWSPGKVTAADTAFASARAELLREQVRAGLASCYGTNPVMLDPAPGSTLPGRTVTFSWSTGSGWDGYRIDVGRAAGGTEYASVAAAAPQAIVTNLPCDGKPIYVSLWSHAGTYVNPTDYQYTACSNGGAQIVSPVPGSNLFSSTVTFAWTSVSGADSYRLDLGTKPAGSDIASVSALGASTTVTNIPTDGRIVYARIVAHTPAGFQTPNDYAYNNFFAITPAISSVANAVVTNGGIAPGSLATVSGINFGDTPGVTVGSLRAAVLSSASGTQATFVVPLGLTAGNTTMTVTSNGLTSAPFTIALSQVAPALSAQTYDSAGGALSRAVQPGEAVGVQATGLGQLGANGYPALPLIVQIGANRVSATLNSFVPVASSPGVYQINFVVPIGTPSGNQPLSILVGGVRSNEIALRIAGPAVNAVLNAASFAKGAKVAPGSLVSIFGDSLASGDAFGVYPSFSLPGGGAITINGISAPLFDVVASQGQVNLLVPFETPSDGNVQVIVTNAKGASAPFSLAMAPAAPGIFRIPDPSNSKRSNAAVLVANTAWRVLPLSMAAALGIPQDCKANNVPIATICGQPAAPGDAIQIYATGLGRATPNGAPFGNSLRTGDVAPADGRTLYMTVETPRVTIGGIDAQVVFSGIAPGFAGLYQINAVIPGGVAPGDDVPVVVTIGGASDQATIAIRAR